MTEKDKLQHAPDGPAASQAIRVDIVEDDGDLRNQMADSLAQMGFAARGYGCASDYYLGLVNGPADVLVLDLALPGEHGSSVLRRLRAQDGHDQTGCVILTGDEREQSQVENLLDGADAYLVKPVTAKVLGATITSVHRRLRAGQSVEPQSARTWSMQDHGWVLHGPGGARITLTQNERALLGALFENAGGVVSRAQLIEAMGHHTEYYLDHRLDMVIWRLRRKIARRVDVRLPLRAVRGQGFVLTPSE